MLSIKEQELMARVKKFIDDEQITCREAIYQSDNVILNAYDFIDDLCEIAGYYDCSAERAEDENAANGN